MLKNKMANNNAQLTNEFMMAAADTLKGQSKVTDTLRESVMLNTTVVDGTGPVGVPVMAPVAVFSVIPVLVGRGLGLMTANVNGDKPPVGTMLDE